MIVEQEEAKWAVCAGVGREEWKRDDVRGVESIECVGRQSKPRRPEPPYRKILRLGLGSLKPERQPAAAMRVLLGALQHHRLPSLSISICSFSSSHQSIRYDNIQLLLKSSVQHPLNP